MTEQRAATEDIEPGPHRWISVRRAALALAIYVALYCGVGYGLWWWFGDIQNAGIFGDMFGSFNAFVSGVAMLGVIAAIVLQMDQNRMQSQELSLQRRELELTRDEMKGQKEALEAQNQLARRTSETAIMSQLMVEYDSMRDSIRVLQTFYRKHGSRENAAQVFRQGRIAPDQNNEVMTSVDPARFRVSRYFVRIRKLSTAGFLSPDLVRRALSREAIQDIFLSLVDPLDQVINDVANKKRSVADRDFYDALVSDEGDSAA